MAVMSQSCDECYGYKKGRGYVAHFKTLYSCVVLHLQEVCHLSYDQNGGLLKIMKQPLSSTPSRFWTGWNISTIIRSSIEILRYERIIKVLPQISSTVTSTNTGTLGTHELKRLGKNVFIFKLFHFFCSKY